MQLEEVKRAKETVSKGQHIYVAIQTALEKPEQEKQKAEPDLQNLRTQFPNLLAGATLGEVSQKVTVSTVNWKVNHVKRKNQ